MFTRFATREDRGLFQVAYELERSSSISAHETRLIRRHLDWFETELRAPPRWVFDHHPEDTPRSWFRNSAHRMIEEAWRFAGVLGDLGEVIEMARNNEPGAIVFEDTVQIVVAPLASAPRPRRARRRPRDRSTIRSGPPTLQWLA